MSKKRSIGKVIFGIWFWPYGIYLIIKHFKNKKEKKIRLEKKRNDDKKKRDNDRRIANKSRIEKERLEKETQSSLELCKIWADMNDID